MVHLTDIFGHPLPQSLNRAVIFLHTTPDLYQRLTPRSELPLWRLHPEKVAQCLREHRLDPLSYLPLGDLLQPSPVVPLILYHPQVAQPATSYHPVKISPSVNLTSGRLWEPSDGAQYVGMGLIYSSTRPTPQQYQIGVVRRELLRLVEQPGITRSPSLAPMNEYQLIGLQTRQITFDQLSFVSQLDQPKLSRPSQLKQPWYPTGNPISPEILGEIPGSSLRSELNSRYSSMSSASSHDSTQILDPQQWNISEGKHVQLVVPEEAWFYQRPHLQAQSQIRQQIQPAEEQITSVPEPLLDWTNLPDPTQVPIQEGFSGEAETVTPVTGHGLRNFLIGVLALGLIFYLWKMASLGWIRNDPMSVSMSEIFVSK